MESNIEITDNIETGKINLNNIEELMNVDLTNKTGLDTIKKSIKQEYRKVMVPPNRMKPLKENWPTIVKALVVYNIF